MAGMKSTTTKGVESPTEARGSDFKPGKSKAEEGTSVKHGCSVDLASGQTAPNAEEAY